MTLSLRPSECAYLQSFQSAKLSQIRIFEIRHQIVNKVFSGNILTKHTAYKPTVFWGPPEKCIFPIIVEGQMKAGAQLS
jgi:hypothetical protein